MIEVIKTHSDLCTGCNRCVRECPMETANVTYLDDSGNIKVKIDNDKCIVCGRCVTACKHNARYYLDDTERFFDDLSKGVPISLMVAPAVRTNISDYKKLFTWLKRLGVNKIYDVSLGADISIWAHVRYLEKNNFAPIITQPCPVIVRYCEIYHSDLLKWLSPVHGPTGSLSVYMKQYEGIEDRIAAMTPCIAKSHEFYDTNQAEYNVTFSKLLAYLKEHNVVLPDEETPFDHHESGLGSLFPMPGGLKENIEYFVKKNIHITNAEGFHVYAKLNKYAETPEDFLPVVFDVLNCIEGCNIGPAASHGKSVFEIDKTMDDNRRRATEAHNREHYESVYKKFDDTFDLAHFIREYRPVFTPLPQIADADISNAFELLGKTDYEKQNVDCGACGSETCHQMARKIALSVNIPVNCIVKSMEDAKIEHEQNMLAHSQIAAMEKIRETDERMRRLLDSTPLVAQFWDENFEIVEVNLAAVKLFNLSSKQEYIDKYFDLTPECQPDGSRSVDKLRQLIAKTFQEGYQKFEWIRRSLDGKPIPVEMTLVRVDDKGRKLIAGYCRDQREEQRMLQEMQQRDQMLDTVISNYSGIIWSVNKEGTITIFNGLYLNTIGVTPDFLEGKKLEIARNINRHLDIIDRVGKTFAGEPQDWISDIDGKKFHARTVPVFDEKGQISDVVGSIDDVTDMIELQKELQTALRQAEVAVQELAHANEQNALQLAKLNLVVQTAKIGLWDMDITQSDPINPKNACTWSKEFRLLLGYTDENDFPNVLNSWSDCIHPEDKEKVFNAFERHMLDTTGGTPYDMEYRMFKKDGKCAYFRDCGETVRDSNGTPLRVAGALLDITESKKLIEQAQEMEERTLLLLDSTPMCGKLWSQDMKLLACNDECRRLFELSSKQEFLDRFFELSPEYQPDGRLSTKAAAEWLAKAFEEGHCRFDWMHQTLHGEPIQSEVILVRMHYKGEYVVAGYIKDLREHNRMMEDIRTASTKLAVESSTLKTMFDSVPDLIFCKDLDSNYTRCNESFLQYFNLEREDVIGKDDSEGLKLPAERLEEFRSTDRKTIVERRVITYEERLPACDGSMRLFETNKIPLLQEGNVTGVMGIARDITERKAMEEAAQSANKAKSAFLSTMSHEIRTPMNAILGIAEIQLQNESLDSSVRDALEKIYTSGDMLLGIINDILDLSKIEAGKLELIVDPYQIASLISDTAQLNIMRIGSKPIAFELQVAEDMPANLVGDELRVKQILNNLLSNAFKYTAEGTVKLSVTAEPSTDNEDVVMLIITVSDTGQGMTKEQIGQLFDEYARFNTATNRSTEGTGLGMSITNNLIRLMNGDINIESEQGKGSVFTVRLVQGKSGSELLGAEMAANLQQFRTSNRMQMKRVQITREPMPYGSALIVDDVETNIYVAKGLLTPYELQIDSAMSGFAAIEKIKAGNQYNIIFMDHMMPKMDGMEATKIIRDMGYDRPIVALTANAVSGQADIFLQNGFDDFISKPIDIRQLNSILNKFVRDKQLSGIIQATRELAQNETLPSDDVSQPAINPQIAKLFVQDASKALAALEPMVETNDYGSEETMRTYILNVHSMKSVLAVIGKMDLSTTAGKLESAGREGNLELITSETPTFVRALRAFVEGLTLQEDQTDGAMSAEDESRLREKLLAIRTACAEYDDITVDESIRELNKTTWSQPVRKLLSQIAEHLLHSDFDEIVAAIDKMETGNH